MNGSRFRAGLLLVLTFAAGTAAGVAADRFRLLPGAAQAAEERGARSDDGGRREGRGERQTTIEQFADELGLTPSQRADIDAVLEHYRASIKFMWSEVRPRYRSFMDSARTRIEAVLTPDQVEQYRALLEERSQRRERGRDDADQTRKGEPRDGEKPAPDQTEESKTKDARSDRGV